MKNKLLFAILFITTTLFQIHAQSNEAKYGFRAGANYSEILLSEDIPNDTSEPRLGAVVGFFVEYPISDLLTIQPELQYVAQGNQEPEARLNYLQMPVFLKFNLTEMFHIHIGPQVGFKVWEWERSDNYNTFEFSAIGGIGLNITRNFIADLRYSYGFTDVFENPEDSLVDFPKGNNTYVQFTLGYKL